jgi:hypothetical protein
MTAVKNKNSNRDPQSPFHVLGIALVVDEIGKGARLAFRYPVSPTVENTDDLFFTLPSRVMAKLFRPKKPLCGQPMTISVGGTVFCCRAILMDDDDNSHLDLFNLVVALAPSVPTSTLPVSGWFDADADADNDTETMSTPSASFLTIRMVHVSIARLCRVLEREERRCQYVSLQSTQLIKIHDQVQQEMDQRSKLASGTHSVDVSTADATQNSKRRAHRRGLSGSTVPSMSVTTPQQTEAGDLLHTKPQEHVQYEVEQDIMELLMAQGKLAHELVQVYHALAWDDHEFLPTPSILLSGSPSIVYINGHIAVCMESSASSAGWFSNNDGLLPRSYQTLLFPHASPKELVETLSSTPQKRLGKLLFMVNPRKALTEIAVDAALPLPVILELAAFLVQQKTCVVSSTITRATKLACTANCVRCMKELAVDFSQEFGLSIFTVTSVLTSGLTLGECMSAAAGTLDNEEAILLGREISKELGPTSSSSPVEIEEAVYGMAVWLRSHQVVVGMEEYLVAVGVTATATAEHKPSDADESVIAGSDVVEVVPASAHSAEEAMYNELANVLTGNVSTAALCWRCGIDTLKLHRFRSWGVVNNKLRVVTRAPNPNDDWHTNDFEQ